MQRQRGELVPIGEAFGESTPAPPVILCLRNMGE